MSTSPITPSPVTTPVTTPPPSTSSTSAQSGVDPLATESTFLKLLVAQLQNQDPESPADGTQFVAQLATFSTLEQDVQMRSDLDAIKNSLTATPATPATPASPTTQAAALSPIVHPNAPGPAA